MKTFREFLSEAQSIIEITLDDAVDGFDSDLIDKMIGWPGSKIHYKQRNSAVQELISWYMRSNKL